MERLTFGILRYVGKSLSSLYYLSIFHAAHSQLSHNKTHQMSRPFDGWLCYPSNGDRLHVVDLTWFFVTTPYM